ncbi:hypothetical protein [Caulobacter sp. 17J65-9]|uniref:hypothetical protein n=1 Tax=Caulobacter sp. 17J65-9 TaxID=2709382 RepID=UPI0013C6CE9A|nr:hypothetical protein [Caulobacter sp. 17J65-9]NEX94532.1 hypothetical protein [Caulobacter sp. 17J65-9]
MHVHKPKAPHGAREFAAEIGVIVVGILIALSGEQMVENLRHEHEVEIGERALKADYVAFVRHRAEQAATTACATKRLAELRAIVDDGARRGQLGTVGPIPQPAPHSWEITSWDTMVASGAAAHVSPAQVTRYSQISHWARDAQTTASAEVEAWSVFNSLSGAPRRFSDAEQAMLRAEIARAAHFTGLVRDISGTTEEAMIASGRLTPEEVKAARAAGERSGNVTSMCAPIAYRAASA